MLIDYGAGLPQTGQYILAIAGGFLVLAGIIISILVISDKKKNDKEDKK